MTKAYTQIVTADTFQVWLDRTNSLSADIGSIIPTTNAPVVGDIVIDGQLTVNDLRVLNTVIDDLVVTGDINTQQNLTVALNAVVQGDLTVSGDTSLTDVTTNNLVVNNVATFALPISTDIIGNSTTASALETPRTITLDGDISGSFVFDGSGDVTMTTTSNLVANPIELLNALLTVDGNGSGLDSDTLDGLESSQFLRSDQDTTVNGKLTADEVLLNNGANVWRAYVEPATGDLVFSRNNVKMFRMTSTGDFIARGDITAFGTP